MFHSLWPLLCVSQNDSVAESNDDVPLESLNTLLTDISLVSSAGRHGSCYGLIKMEGMAGKVMRVGEKNSKIKWDGRRRAGDLWDVRRLHIVDWGSCAKWEWGNREAEFHPFLMFYLLVTICHLFFSCLSISAGRNSLLVSRKSGFEAMLNQLSYLLYETKARGQGKFLRLPAAQIIFFFFFPSQKPCVCSFYFAIHSWVAHASVLVISLFSLSFSTFTLTSTLECW